MLFDRLPDTSPRPAGALTTDRQRLKIWMQIHRVGISPWVRLALQNQLRSGATAGGAR